MLDISPFTSLTHRVSSQFWLLLLVLSFNFEGLLSPFEFVLDFSFLLFLSILNGEITNRFHSYD